MTDEQPWLPDTLRAHMQDQAPEVVYHYTTQAGLLGIINSESAELWATKVQYLNDATEFNLALHLAKQQVLHLAQSAGPRERPLLDAMARIEGISDVNIFVGCFCRDGDLLSQWRGYSGRSHGFSIAFKSAGLREIARPHDFTLGRCIYDRSLQACIIDEAIHHCLNLGIDPIGTAASFERLLLKFGAFFKQAGFSEENEWRLVSQPILIQHERVAFRVGISMPTPFYKIPLGADLRPIIHGVVVGPCPHPALSESAVKMLLIQAGIRKLGQWGPGYELNVGRSTIPYRNW